MNTPTVSVWLITYNHAAYIQQAIEGVLRQQTSFAVELVIGEDYSTDGTRELVQAYGAKYPDKIRLFLPPRNLGMVQILEPTFRLCTGRYVAMLDGDDYWTDPLKLQKQVEMLEADPTRMFVFHQVRVADELRGRSYASPVPAPPRQGRAYSLIDFLQPSHAVVTLSVLFRNRFAGTLPAWYYQLSYPDLALLILLLLDGGTASYQPDTMGVYRIHAGGAFSSLPPAVSCEQRVQFFSDLKRHVPARHHAQIDGVIGFHYYELLVLALKSGNLTAAARCFRRIVAFDTSLLQQKGGLWRHVAAAGIKGGSYFYKKLHPTPAP